MARGKFLSKVIGLSLGSFLAVHFIPAAVGSIASSHVPHGVLDCSQLEQLWERAGGSPSAAFMAAEIARAESSGRENATDRDSDGTVDRGLWQVNSVHGSLSTYDVLANAKAAVYLSRDGTDWNDWVTYHRETYIGQC